MEIEFIVVGKVAIGVLIVSPWYLLRMLADIRLEIGLGRMNKQVMERKGRVVGKSQ